MSDLRTLYVRRPLRNAEAVISWARRIFHQVPWVTLEDPSDLHVTTAYSKTKVDWSDLILDDRSLDIHEPTLIKVLGGGKVLALSFKSTVLQERWSYFCSHGAAWDYPEYVPHVTFARGREAPKAVVGFFGPILLGPEEAREIKVKRREQVRTPF